MQLRLASSKRMRGEERRRQILDAALSILLDEGIAALRTEKIARKVGLSPGGIFRHYPSKKAILTALAQDLMTHLEATLPAFSAEEAPLDWVEAFVRSRVRTLREAPGVRLLFAPEFEKILPEHTKHELRASLKATWQALLQALIAGQAKGEIRADVPAEELAAAIAALIQAQNTLALAHLEKEGEGADWVWRTIRDLVEERRPVAAD